MSESERNGSWQEWKISHRSLTLLLHYLVKLTLVWLFKAAPAHLAHETVEVLRRETPDFISSDLWPPNSPDLNPVDYDIWPVMQRRLSCRGKSAPSTNWSRGWLKFGAALNSRLSTWLLISGAKDLEFVFVRREDTSNIVFELIDCLDFVNTSPSLSCFVWILHRWVKQHCCKVVLGLQGNVATKLSYNGKFFILVMSHFFLIPTLKEFKKSTNICQSYSKNKSGPVFWLTVYIPVCNAYTVLELMVKYAYNIAHGAMYVEMNKLFCWDCILRDATDCCWNSDVTSPTH